MSKVEANSPPKNWAMEFCENLSWRILLEKIQLSHDISCRRQNTNWILGKIRGQEEFLQLIIVAFVKEGLI